MIKPANSPLTDDEWNLLGEKEKEEHIDMCSKKEHMDEIESVNRFDLFPLETKFDTTEDGFLTGSAIVTRTGVFTYVNLDGSFRYELRTPEEVLKADTMASLKVKPITLNHPKVGLVKSENAQGLVVGSTGSAVRTDGDNVAVDISVFDKKAIAAIKAGKRELSCGYRCETVKQDGIHNGQKYTHVQKNIIYNHVALCDKARAGSIARIRMDGALAPIIENEGEIGMDMKTINLDNVDYQAEPKVIEAYQNAVKSADELKTKLDGISTDKTKVEAERDQLKEQLAKVSGELDALKKVHVDAAEVPKLVQARLELERTAVKLGVEVKADQADDEIRRSIVLKVSPSVDQEKLKDSIYLRARFDMAVELSDEAAKKASESAKDVRSVKGDASAEVDTKKEPTYAEKRKAYIEAQRNAHKQPVKGE